MKPVDKFGRKIYSKTFRILLFYGKLLEEAGYRESKKKPNLFYRKTEDVIFFADMRGTDEVPIWEGQLLLMIEITSVLLPLFRVKYTKQ